MRYFIHFVLLLLPHVCWAGNNGVETASHYYILGTESRILVIDRRTGEEIEIKAQETPRKTYEHQGVIYVTFYDSLQVMILDQKMNVLNPFFEDQNQGIKRLMLSFWGDYVLVANVLAKSLTVVHRQDGRAVHRFDIQPNLKSLAVVESYLCLCYEITDSFDVFDLAALRFHKKVSVRSPRKIIQYGNCAYVSCSESQCIAVFTIPHFIEKSKIQVGRFPGAMTIYKDHLYVKCRLSDSIYIVDLRTSHVVASPFCFEKCLLRGPLVVRGTRGYIPTWGNQKLWVLDLENNVPLALIDLENTLGKDNCFGRMFLTDKHLYIRGLRAGLLLIGLTKFAALDLFKNVQTLNASFDLYDDGSKAMDVVVRSFETADMKNVTQSFCHALACGNPKAYAFAAYAYLHGRWGAKEDLGLYHEYIKEADKECYNWLVEWDQEYLKSLEKPKSSAEDQKRDNSIAFNDFYLSSWDLY